jgi:hypothetical protein
LLPMNSRDRCEELERHFHWLPAAPGRIVRTLTAARRLANAGQSRGDAFNGDRVTAA